MDLYDLLGLPRGATLIEIKRSFKRLARKYHPDINPGDRAAEVRFREITLAYETLSDPERRGRYDTGAMPGSSGSVSFEFEGFDFSGSTPHGAATTFGDLFADVFTRPRASRTGEPERGADLYAMVSLGFDEAMQGTQRHLTVTRRESCRSCLGSGVLAATEGRCPRCEGAGAVRSRRGSMVFSRNCETCGGLGRVAKSECGRCAGLGVETRSETMNIRIPAGVRDGARVRVAEKGNAGIRGGRHGDLYVAVHVAADDTFQREGDDLHTAVSVGIHEAALGARIEVRAPDGPARLRVPPGTQTGQRFRIRGRGAPSPRDGARGDLVVEIRIMLPKVLDERSKELLREFGRINGGEQALGRAT